MRELQTESFINVSAERVFEVLTALEEYPRWNPFILEAHGKVAMGERLKIVIKLAGKPASSYQVKVLCVLPGREFAWRGHFKMRGLIDGDHFFEIFPVCPGLTRFVHREEFRGLLIPFVWGPYLSTRMKASFEAHDQALKKRCELNVPDSNLLSNRSIS